MTNEIKEQEQEQKVETVVELSIKLMNDGQITLDISNGDIGLDVIENMAKKTYESIYEQRIVQMALEAFKQKLS